MSGQDPDRRQERARQGDESASDALEDLEDEGLVAQQSAAHSPKPRQKVRMEAQSVVISEPAPPRPRRSRRPAEPTLVIRDRRRLDELRKAVDARAASKRRRGLWFWLVAGLFAFALGGSVALLASRSNHATPTATKRADRAPPKGQQAPSERVEKPPPETESIDMEALQSSPKTKVTREDPNKVKPVSLDDLPVEK